MQPGGITAMINSLDICFFNHFSGKQKSMPENNISFTLKGQAFSLELEIQENYTQTKLKRALL